MSVAARLLGQFICALVIFISVESKARADLIFSFTRSATGGVNVTGSGTGIVQNNSNRDNWSIRNFNSDFIDDALGTFTDVFADTVSGTLSVTRLNGTTNSVSLDGFSVDRDPGTNDDIGWTSGSGSLRMRRGWTYDLSLSSVFDQPTLDFSMLIPGTYVATSNIFGTVTLNVSAVPEPSPLWLVAFAGLIGGLIYMIRKWRLNVRSPATSTV